MAPLALRDYQIDALDAIRAAEAIMRLGSWVCPSGNSVDVFSRRSRDGVLHADFQWDEPPPLRPVDQRYYSSVIVPAVTRLVQSLIGHPGRVLYVRL